MKNWITIALSGAGALCVMFFLTACPGKGSSASNNTLCSLGYVSTGYGCLPQGGCPYGQGYYSQTGQCVAGTPGGSGGGYGTYPTFSAYQTSFINQWSCEDFVGRISGMYTCTNSITYTLQTMSTTLPTQAVLQVVIGNYQSMAMIQGTVNAINSNTQAQFVGQYGAMTVGLRMQGLLTNTSMQGYMWQSNYGGQDFAGVQLNKLY